MQQREIADRIIAHLRKYDCKALISPQPFAQKLECSYSELKAAQVALLENGVISCISDSVSAPEYKLLDAYREGDEWQIFFPEEEKKLNTIGRGGGKNISGKIVTILQESHGKITTTSNKLAEDCDCTASAILYSLKQLQKKGIVKPVQLSWNRSGTDIFLEEKYLSGEEWRTRFSGHSTSGGSRKLKQNPELEVEKIKKADDLSLDPLSIELHKALTKLDETQNVAIKEIKRLKEALEISEEKNQRYKTCILQLQIKLDEKAHKDTLLESSNKELLSKVEDNERALSVLVGSS